MGHLVSSVNRLFLRAVDRELRSLDITAAQLAPLLALSESPELMQRDLARRLATTQPAMVKTLSRLERDGLIARRPDDDDGRAARISLTDEGRTLVEAALPALRASNETALAGFSEREERELTAYLQRLARSLDGPNFTP